jgi:hypothetical protein
MIEALACGTPVIAYRHGSVPEVLEDGVTGYIVPDENAAVEALQRIPELSRRRCREVFEERFSDTRMARDYLAIYSQLAEEESIPRLRLRAAPSYLPPLHGGHGINGGASDGTKLHLSQPPSPGSRGTVQKTTRNQARASHGY